MAKERSLKRDREHRAARLAPPLPPRAHLFAAAGTGAASFFLARRRNQFFSAAGGRAAVAHGGGYGEAGVPARPTEPRPAADAAPLRAGGNKHVLPPTPAAFFVSTRGAPTPAERLARPRPSFETASRAPGPRRVGPQIALRNRGLASSTRRAPFGARKPATSCTSFETFAHVVEAPRPRRVGPQIALRKR